MLFKVVSRLREISTVTQYRNSLHVSCSSEVVWIAIADVRMNFVAR